MLQNWTKILPCFIIEKLGRDLCERLTIKTQYQVIKLYNDTLLLNSHFTWIAWNGKRPFIYELYYKLLCILPFFITIEILKRETRPQYTIDDYIVLYPSEFMIKEK